MLYRFCIFLFVTCALHGGDISGEWEFELTYLKDPSPARMVLKMDGGKVSGTINELTLDGAFKGSALTFTAARPDRDEFGKFEGELNGDQLQGSGTRPDGRKMTWTARRAAPLPAKPRVHDFEPTEFYRLFSDAIPPALRIAPGDTVRTWTVDAGGVDSKGVQRSKGGNPQTGPFYVEGAMPGDTLVVKLNRLRLNRDSAVSGDWIVPSAVTPGYVQAVKHEKFDSTWVLDRAKGIARLKNPSKHLKNYTVKLQPMLGCIAVAPPGHMAFRTGYLGSYGGNLDYNQIREGTTVYLPVSAAGALLFVGDGHAAQGDGELTGDALETSMDLEFTVNLVKGEATNMPRAESDEYLMALGVANSPGESIQTATTELARWLAREYQLNPNEAAIVLGTAIEYNVAELCDPLHHVVAKIRKSALMGLK